jgi:hypothetical protein
VVTAREDLEIARQVVDLVGVLGDLSPRDGLRVPPPAP